MGLTDYLALRYDGGDYASPEKLTEIGRVLQNANERKVTASIVVKATSGLLFGFTVSSVAGQFILGFDASELPAEAAVPLFSLPVAATSVVGANWIPPRSFRNGLVLCNSSTQHTKTIGSADCIFDVQFL